MAPVTEQRLAALSAETDAAIAEALGSLERDIRTARATNDPLAQPLKALAATVGALHRLFADGTLALQEAQRHTPILTPDAERQLLDSLAQEGRKAVRDATWEAHRQMNWRLAAAVGAAVAGLMLVTGVGSYWTGWWQRGHADAADHSLRTCLNGEAMLSPDGTRKGCVVWLGPAARQP